MNLPPGARLPPIKLAVCIASAEVAADGSAAVSVTADRGGVAAYVWLSTRAAGGFEPNGFMMAAHPPRDSRL